MEKKSIEESLQSVTNNLDRVSEMIAQSRAEAKERQDQWDAELKKRDAEAKKRKAEFDEEIRKINESMGHYSNNIGVIAEQYFFNSFKKGKTNFFGEKFDDIEKNVRGIKKDFKDEYDILLINGRTIGIVEVKTKAHENDIPKILKKAKTFRANFPEYENHKVYLGLATMSFYPELEDLCAQHGLAIIQNVGETLIFNYEHLKEY